MATKPLCPKDGKRRQPDAKQLARDAVKRGRIKAEKIIAARARELRGKRIRPFAYSGLLIAEGDSWFSYIRPDIVARLENEGFQVASDAAAGDRIQEMVSQLPRLHRLIDQQTSIPRAALLSGGGNDIVERSVLTSMLNRADSPAPGWNWDVVNDVIDGKIKTAYLEMIGAITTFCTDKFGQPVPIILHGYSHPVPDGRPVAWKGPWLAPVFVAQGYDDGQGYPDLPRCTPLAGQVIDCLNEMLKLLPSDPALAAVHAKVVYLDVRPELSSDLQGKRWKESWENEMHPTPAGFERITQRFLATIP